MTAAQRQSIIRSALRGPGMRVRRRPDCRLRMEKTALQLCMEWARRQQYGI